MVAATWQAQGSWGSFLVSLTPDRREVLVVCADEEQRQTYRRFFERQGLRVLGSPDCRGAIAASFTSRASMVVIVGRCRDGYAGPLINALASSAWKPRVWLIGNPRSLCLSEIVRRHEVAVLPDETTPDQLENVLFS
jgi:hypothetical protein